MSVRPNSSFSHQSSSSNGKAAISRRTFLRGAAASAALMLAACAAPTGAPAPGSNDAGAPSGDPIVLRLHMRAGGETAEVPIYVTRPAEFTEATGVQVQLEPVPEAEYWAKIETLAASATLGDNMFTDEKNWQHSRAVHFGILQEIDDFMESESVSRDEWLPGVFETCIVNGKVYGLPKTGHPAHAYIWINHDMFEAAGLLCQPKAARHGRIIASGPMSWQRVILMHVMPMASLCL